MYPELFKIGPFTVYSFGLMLGIAFIVASYLLTKEIERRKLHPNIATEVTLLAIVFGIVGSKALDLIENWDMFIKDPIGSAFSPGGLTFYGGVILVIIVLIIYTRRKKIPFLFLADAVAPSLAIGYGIGRIGCHLAGDGDYGIPTNLPWGVDYSHGTVPPHIMFRGTEIAKSFPNGIVPDNTPLHPTPIYEFIMMMIIFWVLWRLRKKDWPYGQLFTIYLILQGMERFLIEFIRLNPRIMFGLSEAQLISVVMILVGSIGLFYYKSHPDINRFTPPPFKLEPEKKKKK